MLCPLTDKLHLTMAARQVQMLKPRQSSEYLKDAQGNPRLLKETTHRMRKMPFLSVIARTLLLICSIQSVQAITGLLRA